MDEERTPEHELGDLPEERPSGEDHRDGPPGYDLDEQEAIEELQEERAEDDG